MISIEHTLHRTKILRKLELPFGNMFFCRYAIISEINEDVVFGIEEAQEVMKYAIPFYKNKPEFNMLTYIANRIHKYSVKPIGWVKLKEVPNYLHAYCVVDDSRHGIMNALLESKFVPINFKSVKNLDDAMNWAEALIPKLKEGKEV